MVKGIHKQIIEIKCTNSEYFEKILLIVRSDQALPYNKILSAEAASLLEQLPPIRHEKSRLRGGGIFSRLYLQEKIFVCVICILCAVLLAALICTTAL